MPDMQAVKRLAIAFGVYHRSPEHVVTKSITTSPGCDYTSTSHACQPTIWPFSHNNLPDSIILFRKYENREVALLRDVKGNVKC